MVLGAGIAASDVDRGTPVPPLAERGFELPLASGLCRLEPPPRQLLASFTSRMPAALAPDGRQVTAATLTLSNTAQAGADSILVDHLTLRGADRAGSPLPTGSASSQGEVLVNGNLLGQSSA